MTVGPMTPKALQTLVSLISSRRYILCSSLNLVSSIQVILHSYGRVKVTCPASHKQLWWFLSHRWCKAGGAWRYSRDSKTYVKLCVVSRSTVHIIGLELTVFLSVTRSHFVNCESLYLQIVFVAKLLNFQHSS